MSTETTPRTILVVEDERALQRVIKKDLEDAGFEAVFARTAPEAIGMVRDGERPLSAVWLDHYLAGGGTGLEVLKELQLYERYADTPVFLVSNTASDHLMEKYREHGITRCFAKLDSRLDSIVEDIIENAR